MGKPVNDEKDLASIVFTLVFIALVSIAAWRLISHLPKIQPTIAPSVAVDSPPPRSPNPKPQETIQARAKRFGIREDLLAQLLQAQPDRDARNLLNLLESLTPAARRGMGTYRRVNYELWLVKATQAGMSVRSLEALADAQFVSWFPSQNGKTLNPRILGQVWYAIARTQINQIQPRTIELNKTYDGIMNHGQGKIYQAKLKKDQTINLKLETSEDIAKEDIAKLFLFSRFNNTFVTLKKTSKTIWTGKIRESGIYEIVIVPNTIDKTEYQLTYFIDYFIE